MIEVRHKFNVIVTLEDQSVMTLKYDEAMDDFIDESIEFDLDKLYKYILVHYSGHKRMCQIVSAELQVIHETIKV